MGKFISDDSMTAVTILNRKDGKIDALAQLREVYLGAHSYLNSLSLNINIQEFVEGFSLNNAEKPCKITYVIKPEKSSQELARISILLKNGTLNCQYLAYTSKRQILGVKVVSRTTEKITTNNHQTALSWLIDYFQDFNLEKAAALGL